MMRPPPQIENDFEAILGGGGSLAPDRRHRHVGPSPSPSSLSQSLKNPSGGSRPIDERALSAS